jgi:hypothetical protein
MNLDHRIKHPSGIGEYLFFQALISYRQRPQLQPR